MWKVAEEVRVMGNIRITRQSNFLDGIAYPSLHYGYDFGSTSEGLHNPARIAEVNRDFAEFSRNGVHLVRMNVFTDGRLGSGIVFDQQGNPTGIDLPSTALGNISPTIIGLRNVIAAARANNIQLSFVMLDHTYAEGPGSETDQQGHGALFRNAQSRQQLLNVLQPFLDEIGRDPANVLSVELINEPESLIGGWSTNRNMPNLLAQRDDPAFKQFMRDFRDRVHAAGAQFTVGSLALRFAANWLDVLDPARDYLSIHYYAQNGEPPYSDLYQPLGQLKSVQARIPVVWGEYAANGANEFPNANIPQQFGSTRQFLEDSLNGGMKGGFAWAFYGPRGQGDMFGIPPLGEHRNFTADHSLRIEFAGGRPPALPRQSLLDRFRNFLSPGTLRTGGASRPATPASRPSPAINRWNPFDSRNLSNPNNPINIQRNLQASAERSRRLSESANRQAELARASARRAQEMATRRTFTQQGLSNPIRTGASSPSFTRPPFRPLGGPRTTFGGPPVNPHGLPHRQAHHIPSWRDYHRPKTTGNPFGPQVTNWGTLPIRTHHLQRHHRPAYRPPPIGVMRPGSLVS
jgi:hypothetical protein